MTSFRKLDEDIVSEVILDDKYNRMIEYSNGDKEWVNASGNLHRLDGPALEYADGWGVSWVIDGKLLNKEEWFAALTPEQKHIAIWSM